MARSKTHRQRKRSIDELLDKGAMATALGLVMVAAPVFLSASSPLKSMVAALRTPGLMALGIGVLLLVTHFVLQSRQDSAGRQPFNAGFKAKNSMRWQDGLPELFDLPLPVHNQNGLTANTPPSWSQTTADQSNPLPASFTAGKPHALSSWSPAVFAAIEWRRFEAVCEMLCAQGGYKTSSQSHGADGGVDIWLHLAHAQSPVAAVQCKHWQGKAVGVKEMREFFGVLASHQLKGGIYATTSSYTADAAKFAKDNGINAMDGPHLLALIASRTPEQQQALLDVAYEGDYWRPTCASCGIKLVERQPANGGAGFWGCSNYPRCRSKLPMAVTSR